jgi:hypothetical protein
LCNLPTIAEIEHFRHLATLRTRAQTREWSTSHGAKFYSRRLLYDEQRKCAFDLHCVQRMMSI